MIAPLVLLLVSFAGIFLARSDPDWTDVAFLAYPSAFASLYLIIRARDPWVRAGRPVIIDGTNVLYWADPGPDLKLVKKLSQLLARRGLRAGVIFDSNIGYKLSDKFMDEAALARELGLSADRVLVVPKGEPAEKYILAAARGYKARVVTNDRYRAWVESFPEVDYPGFLVPGGVSRGKPWITWTKVR